MKEAVAIIGAGLSGLMLARVLHLRGHPAVIYEGDASRETRRQGGQLDIHEPDGQRALAMAGLTQAFKGIIHHGAEATRIVDPQGALLFEEADPGDGGRPEVLRGELRDILLDSLPAETVRWGKRLARAEPLGDGRHGLTFTDGERVTTACLVGADGAWSKVRSLLSDATPTYTGVTFVETFLHDADVRHADTARMVGSGAMFALTPGNGIVTHREAGGVLHTYVELVRPEAWVDAIDFDDAEASAAHVAAEFDGWSPALTALITGTDTPPVARKIHTLPTGLRWERTAGVTLLGDAAHLMPPTGEGANLAMFDGAELAEAIVSTPSDVEAALARYETAMFTRSASSAASSGVIMDLCLNASAPQGLIDFFRG